MPKLQLKGSTTCLVLCEGIDAKFFLIWLLDYYKKHGISEFEHIQVEDFGGITQLSDSLAVWKNISGFKKQINSLCIIRDAETNFLNSCQSIRGSLQKNDFPVSNQAWAVKDENGFKVAYLVFPGTKDENGNYKAGTLEDLCLEALADNSKTAKLSSIDSFIEQAKNEFNIQFPRLHKTRLHEFLVMHDKFVDCKIGEAAKAGAFDFENDVIKEIAGIFKELVKSK